MANSGRPPVVGLVWSQFSAYHVDRLEAVGRRLLGRARVLSVEVASSSATYAWDPSGDVEGTEKHRLFQGQMHEKIPLFRRFVAQLRVLLQCDIIFVGVAYSQPDIIALSYLLRLLGKQVVMMTASKFDDFQRSASREFAKRLLLSPYSAAVVGGRRQFEYVRFLGFKRKLVLPGYNTVSMRRVLDEAKAPDEAEPAYESRPFVFVGRFVDKKNIPRMLEGFARYAANAGAQARRLVLIGDGPLRSQMLAQCADLGIEDLVDFAGFLPAAKVSAHLARSLALVLVSEEEQWGLVINEALAVGLPVIVSADVGAREALVRNLLNGVVVEACDVEDIARSFALVDTTEAKWQAMSAAATQRAWHADAERFADAVEQLVFPGVEPATSDSVRFASEILINASRVSCV